MKSIYSVDIEVTHMEGTQLPSDCGGGFVSVYLRDNDIRSAIDSAEDELLSDLYKPIEVNAAYKIEEEEFYELEIEEGYPEVQDLQNILKNGGVWYGPFHLYPIEGNKIN